MACDFQRVTKERIIVVQSYNAMYILASDFFLKKTINTYLKLEICFIALFTFFLQGEKERKNIKGSKKGDF